jgi:hypothetical protein
MRVALIYRAIGTRRVNTLPGTPAAFQVAISRNARDRSPPEAWRPMKSRSTRCIIRDPFSSLYP